MSALAENPRAVIGANNPPEDIVEVAEPTPFELSTSEAEDLFLEATNWCDGAAIETAEQAEALGRLRAGIKAAIKRADDRRREEARPHDEAKATIQARYNALIGDNKTTKGKLILADEACQRALSPWLRKVEEEKQRKAEEARRAAEEAVRAAQEAFRKAEVDDLAARAEAEALAAKAKAASRDANRADKAAVTKTGLRTVVEAEIVDLRAFAEWAWRHDGAALETHFRARAAALAAEGRRDLPGVTITEKREAR